MAIRLALIVKKAGGSPRDNPVVTIGQISGDSEVLDRRAWRVHGCHEATFFSNAGCLTGRRAVGVSFREARVPWLDDSV